MNKIKANKRFRLWRTKIIVGKNLKSSSTLHINGHFRLALTAQHFVKKTDRFRSFRGWLFPVERKAQPR
ncbi:hypothetical protein [Candidatus Pantoea deserta]|uniref:hypothetical protein n=1 Tax=Candidatus Pantoea deserta TaxID=1869313 RepID=UPI000F4FBA3C|nr:hypothetical protein [Pantoea deserta]